jgi:hypothetical protein
MTVPFIASLYLNIAEQALAVFLLFAVALGVAIFYFYLETKP